MSHVWQAVAEKSLQKVSHHMEVKLMKSASSHVALFAIMRRQIAHSFILRLSIATNDLQSFLGAVTLDETRIILLEFRSKLI